MNYKLITCVSLAAFSINTFAFKVLSEEFYASPGSNGSMVILEEKRGNLLTDPVPNPMTLEAITADKGCKIGEYLPVNSHHFFRIANASGSKMLAGYRFSLAALGSDVHSSRNLELDPNETFEIKADLNMTLYPRQSGKFPISAYTYGQENQEVKRVVRDQQIIVS